MERELAAKRGREERAAANGGGAGVNGGGGGGRKDAPWLQPGIIVKVRGARRGRTAARAAPPARGLGPAGVRASRRPGPGRCQSGRSACGRI
jgi:hypothetical protein